eukprot:1220106-Amphidinium_carterae.2
MNVLGERDKIAMTECSFQYSAQWQWLLWRDVPPHVLQVLASASDRRVGQLISWRCCRTDSGIESLNSGC